MRSLLTLIVPLSLLVLQGCDQLQTPRDSISGNGSSSVAPAGPAPIMAISNMVFIFSHIAAQKAKISL